MVAPILGGDAPSPVQVNSSISTGTPEWMIALIEKAAAKGLEEEKIKSPKQEDDSKNPIQIIYNLIKSLDKGDGADIEDVIKESKINNCEDIINNLLREGEIFEIKKGKLKILE